MHTILKQVALKSALVAALGFGVAFNSHAAQASGTFGVTANVAASCTISGATLDFGTFNALGGNVDATSTLSATCTNGSAYTIGLNAGTGADATTTARKMTHSNGTNTLNYSLSATSLGGANWGAVGEAGVSAGTGSGSTQEITVYGRIPSGQTGAIAGAYSDIITATIDF